MKIKKVVIEGFRAYQGKADGTFDFSTADGDCANFVSIYAPNGFGKTSFYDAVEWNLTNNVGRFVRDVTRIQNEALSRSQNQENRKQHILRNRFISDEAPSQVTVIASTFTKTKEVPKAKRGSRDYLFHKEEPDPDMGVLGDIFLSQEAIDAFLREEKPEARYARFMTSFGDEDEIYRANLTAIKRELNISLKSARDEKDRLKSVAETPVRPSILEELNQTIGALDKDGEQISALKTDFDADALRMLRNLITKRIHELSTVISETQTAISELTAVASGLEYVSAAKDGKLAAQNDIDTLIKLRDLLERRTKLVESITRLEKDVSDTTSYISRLATISEQIPEFIELAKKSAATQELLRTMQEGLIATQGEISSFEQRSATCRRLLAEIDTSTNALTEVQRNAASIFQEIDAANELKASREVELTNTNLRAQLLGTKIGNCREELAKVEAIDVSVASIDSADVTPLIRQNFSLTPLKVAVLERQAKAALLEGASKVLDQVKNQASQVASLITLGAELASKTHSDECPLCSHHHESHAALIDRIINNTALSKYEAEAVRTKETAQHEFDAASQNLASLLDEWKASQNKVALSLREAISIDEADLRAALVDARRLELEKKNADENIKKLRLSVLDRSPDQLAEYINAQLGLLDSRRQTELKDLENCLVEVEKRQLKAKTDSQWVEQQRAEMRLSADTDMYRNVMDFCSAEDVSVERLPTYVSTRKNEQEQGLLALRKTLDESVKELSGIDMNSPTLAQRTRQSIDDDELRARARFAGADATLVGFASSMRRHIAAFDDGWSVAEIAANVIAYIAESQNRVAALTLRSGKYSLLGDQINDALPYMQAISAKKDLDRVIAVILRQEALVSELDTEYARTIERLQRRVRGFFYTDLINAIYRKIDPHPDFKQVQFDCDFSESDRPRLNVLVADEKGETVVPNLYFSAAQINILSLSIFLARALHVKQPDGKDVQCILIDDPIHSMDSINVLSTIDLLRNISKNFDRQIILSTHDRNFFDLLRKKIPEHQYNSKFIELETFGKVRVLQDMVD